MTDYIATITEIAEVVEVNGVESIQTVAIESVEVGIQGPRGPQGERGLPGSAEFTAVAGEALSGHRAVRLSGGLAYYCDGGTVAHAGSCVGMTTSAALVGATVNVQAMGSFTEPTFNYSEGPLFVGANGVLSTTPGSAFAQEIARVTNTTTIFLNIQPAILKV